jgi:hypothetical protein
MKKAVLSILAYGGAFFAIRAHFDHLPVSTNLIGSLFFGLFMTGMLHLIRERVESF